MLIFVRSILGVVTPLTVSPYETISSVKYRMHQLKGIAVSQQHLLYDGIELPDPTILLLAKIGHGALLRLVLGLRSGPLIRDVSDANGMGCRSKNAPFYHSSSAAAMCHPLSVPVGRPIPNRELTMVLPVVCKASSLQRPLEQQRLSHHRSLHSSAYSHEVSHMTREYTTFLDDEEVSEIAELLGYAIDENELAVQSETSPESSYDTLPPPTSTLSSNRSLSSSPSDFGSPFYHVVPLHVPLIPLSSHPTWIMDHSGCLPLSDSVSRTPSAPYSAPSEPSSLTGAPMFTNEPLTSKPILPLANVPDLICSASILSSSPSQRPLEPTVLVECQTSSSAVSIDSFDHRADSTAVSPAHLHRSPLIASHPRSAGDLPSLHQPTSFLSSYQTPSASTEQFDEIHSDNQPVFGNHSDPSPTSFAFSSELPDGVHSCSLRAQHFSEDVSVQTGVSPSPTPLNRRPDSNRCSRCRRRTGPVGGFSCRCGRWFCIKHHHPEDHCCDYDFKTMKPAHSTISVAIPPVITDSVRR